MKIFTISTFWNAGNHVKNCIESLKNQYYTNFTSYFIDDVSTDDSYEIARKTIDDDERFILIRNKEKKFKTKNFIDVIRNNSKIDWDDVIIEIDGDDMLSDKFVLGRINKVFMDDNIWLCGTRWKDKSGRLGNYAKPNPERARSTVWNFSHMRSFRSFLFREIKDEHLKFNSEYFKGACDLGHGIPMLEMCGSEHFHYIDEPLYTYTWHQNQTYSDSGGIGDKTVQSKTAKHIYGLPKYQKLFVQVQEVDNESLLLIEEQKNKINEALNSIGFFHKPKENKTIDYNKINEILSKKNSYNPKKNVKPIRENTPKNRQELVNLRKGSLAEQSKNIKPVNSSKSRVKNVLPIIL